MWIAVLQDSLEEAIAWRLARCLCIAASLVIWGDPHFRKPSYELIAIESSHLPPFSRIGFYSLYRGCLFSICGELWSVRSIFPYHLLESAPSRPQDVCRPQDAWRRDHRLTASEVPAEMDLKCFHWFHWFNCHCSNSWKNPRSWRWENSQRPSCQG
jgi:hypothetical protein